MHKKHQNLIITLLLTVLVMGTAANASVDVRSCPPRECCCAKAMVQQMDHDGMPVNCTPGQPAPCCQIEQDQAPMHMAISSVPQCNPRRSLLAPMATHWLFPDRHSFLMIGRVSYDALPKAPWVPIYLWTKTLLC